MACTVFVIDDDPTVLQSLCGIVESAGFQAKGFGTAEAFIHANPMSWSSPRCLLLDLRLPSLSGIGLLEQMPNLGIRMPTIVVTGVTSMPLAVQAMKLGVVDLIEKPAHRQLVLERVQYALDLDANYQRTLGQRSDVQSRLADLSPREREVMKMLVDGHAAKAISMRLGITMKTVAKHRTKVFQKMKVDSLVELVRMLGNHLGNGDTL